MERTFFFLGFCLSSIQALWLGFNMDSAKRKNNFSGEKGFSVLLWLISARRKGSGE